MRYRRLTVRRHLGRCASVMLLGLLIGCQFTPTATGKASKAAGAGTDIAAIALGSCLRQWSPQPVWQGVMALAPEAFIFLGDNVYSDVGPYRQQREPDRIGQAYRDLALTADFQDFRRRAAEDNTALLATWDDHDYGVNDGGADYPYREASRSEFAAFFNLDPAQLGDGRLGVYHSRYLQMAGLQVQVVLLDTRSYRSPLKTAERAACPPTGRIANRDPAATVLGEAQWQWLGDELRRPADLRIIASSIQVLPTEHCFEKWANFPRERQRLFRAIEESGAKGVVFVSGDRHLAEISRLGSETGEGSAPYPFYELTSSGLNSAMPADSPARQERNPLRVGSGNVLQDNFGSIQLVPASGNAPGDTVVALQIRNVTGELIQEQRIALDTLR